MILIHCFGVRVFFAEDALGNRADCFFLPKAAPDTLMSALSMQSKFTCCFNWSHGQGIAVCCYQRGHRIQFCGHGLLASIALQLDGEPLLRLYFERTGGEKSAISTSALRTIFTDSIKAVSSTASRGSVFPSDQLEIFTNSHWSVAYRRGGRVWLCIPRIICREIPLPGGIRDCLRPAPIAAALAGIDNGYRVFIWPTGTDIASVVIDRKFLLRGERATILTARHAGTEADFTQRYLAPQYGEAEGEATGSAAAVLADYWVRHGVPPRMRAWQRSSSGGFIEVDIESDTVSISGAAAIEEISQWDVDV